jgi:hypothetical protein
MSLDRLHAGLNDLPTIPQITHLCASLWGPTDIRSMPALFSRMPNLQSTTIILGSSERPERDSSSEIQRKPPFISSPCTKF